MTSALYQRYPWSQWIKAASKRWVTPVKGEHYTCTTSTFRMYLYKIARDRQLKVTTVLHTVAYEGGPERISFFIWDPDSWTTVPPRPRPDQFLDEDLEQRHKHRSRVRAVTDRLVASRPQRDPDLV